MTITIDEMLRTLDRHPERVPLDELTAIMCELRIGPDDLRHCLQFGDDHYRRNLLHDGPGYQALVLCWKAGQRSPIHDHRGSSCGVRVIQGVATETVFSRKSDGMLAATRSRELAEGSVCGSQDSDIHQMSNLQEGDRPLVTLHIYSPALLRMSTYSLSSLEVQEFEDPVYEFAQGAGI